MSTDLKRALRDLAETGEPFRLDVILSAEESIQLVVSAQSLTVDPLPPGDVEP